MHLFFFSPLKFCSTSLRKITSVISQKLMQNLMSSGLWRCLNCEIDINLLAPKCSIKKLLNFSEERWLLHWCCLGCCIYSIGNSVKLQLFRFSAAHFMSSFLIAYTEFPAGMIYSWEWINSWRGKERRGGEKIERKKKNEPTVLVHEPENNTSC